MFASTAYEAYYTYIGIYLHEASIKIITSQEVLIGLLLLILSCSFLVGSWRYASKFMPGLFRQGKTVGIGFFFRLIACFLIGMSLLKVDTDESVKTYERKSWNRNSYIASRMPLLHESYKVSFIFDLFVRAGEEIEYLAGTGS